MRQMLGAQRASKLPFLFLLAAIAVYAGSVVYSGSWLPRPEAVEAAEGEGGPEVTTHTKYLWGQEVSQVMVGGKAVITFRTAAGGRSAVERANVTAHRLSQLINDGLEPGQVHAVSGKGEAMVMGGERLIVTATSLDAGVNRTEPMELAIDWAASMADALGGSAGDPQTEPEAGDDEKKPQKAEKHDHKDVPIVSVGKGLRVGMARVSGPAKAVRLVEAVAQIESRLSNFGDVEIYVPISTEVPGESLERVNECAVVGLADIKVGG